MKKFLSGLIIGAIVSGIIGVFAANYMAETANFKIMVEGEMFETDKPVLAVDGSTYLPLKAIGEALGVPVVWNGAERRVEIGDCSSAFANDAKAVAEKYLAATAKLDGKEAKKYISPDSELYGTIGLLEDGIDGLVDMLIYAMEEESGVPGMFADTKVVMADFFKKVYANVSYEIKDCQVSGDKATVKYTMTIPDTEGIDISVYMEEALSEEALNEIVAKAAVLSEDEMIPYISKQLAAKMKPVFDKALKDIKSVTNEEEMTLNKINGKWLVIED